MVVEIDGDDAAVIEDGTAGDVVGHGTACAGIIHAIAPGAELVSIRVLGPNNRAKGHSFAAAIEWVVQQGIGVANLSLSSRSESLAGLFHELADRAYFANTLLICAANNVAGPSYPSLFASVVSVAAHDVADPTVWFYNPSPPVEFGAYGVDVDVAWRGGGRIRATGNSFAAPHLAGYAALIRARHPDADPVRGQGDPRGDGDASHDLTVIACGRAGRTADALGGRRRRFEGRVLEVAARPGVGTS